MSISDKLVQIASNLQRVFDAGHDSIKLQKKTVRINRNGWYYPKVDEGYDGIGSLQIQVNTPQDNYEAGKKAEYDAFWDEFQQNGNRKDYQGAFYGPGWTNQTFKPKYNMNPSNCGSMFLSSSIEDLGALLEQAGVTLDTSTSKRADSMFYWASNLKKLPILDFRNVTDSNCFQQTFYNATKLETIEKLILSNDGAQGFSNAFYKARSLKNITLEGVIGQNGFNVADCTLLTHESLMSIINALKNFTGDDENTVIGKYYWNGSLGWLSSDIEQDVSFKSEGVSYSGIKLESDQSCRAIIYYRATLENGEVGEYVPVYNSEEWNSDEYMTVDFGAEPQNVSPEFYTYLISNAEKVHDGNTHTVTLGQANISKLSEQEIALATEKGWTIS